MRALRNFLGLQSNERLLLLEAWFYLAAARAALLTIPFKHISRHLGPQSKPGDLAIAGSPASTTARQVGWAVQMMSHHTPWESACLAQSIAGKFMLGRRGISSLLCLGMKKDEAGKVTAHAWLRAGNEILIGSAEHESFTLLSAFGRPFG